MRPDLSYLKAATLVLREHRGVHLILVGCGGTGSHVARSVAQIARVMIDQHQNVEVTLVDPDVVEEKNIPRQAFVQAEIGRPKALALAHRYGAAWGIDIRASRGKFRRELLDGADRLRLVIGCVDNGAARREIAKAVEAARGSDHWMWRGKSGAPLVWWLDCGNDRASGQVALGSAPDAGFLKGAFPHAGICTDLPMPTVQCPTLLEDRPDEIAGGRLSCAELMALNAQALSVNQRVAAEACDFLMRLFITHDLKRFATYFDLPSGTARSIYCTPDAVRAACGSREAAKRPVGNRGRPAAG
ncbi:MAG: PRTRC system ThiF family protein [Acidobacteriota bacterium]